MNFFKKTEWKLFHPIYLGLGIGVAIPDIDMIIMAFFFAKGFSATQVGIGMALQSLFLLLAEIPTGAFADIYGKRKSVQISWFMQSAIFALFFFITEPWMMWLLFSLKGIAHTFSSGAFDALPYEIAKKEKEKGLINKFYSTYEFVYQIATALSNLNVIVFLFLIGATTNYFFLGQNHQGMDFLWLTGCAGYFIGSLILSKIKEDVNPIKVDLGKNLQSSVKLAKKAIQYSISHPVVSKLLFMGIFSQITAILFADIVYQPFLLSLNMGVKSIPILLAIASVVAAAFSLFPKYFSKKFNTEKTYIQTMMILKAIILGSLLFFPNPIYKIFFFFIYFGIDSLINPMMEPFKQYFYKKDMRATLGSVESVAKNLTAVIFFPLVGLAVDKLAPVNTVLLSIVPLIVGLFLFNSIKHQGRLHQ